MKYSVYIGIALLILLSIFLTYKLDVCYKKNNDIVYPIIIDTAVINMDSLLSIINVQRSTIVELNRQSESFKRKYDEYKKVKDAPTINDTSNLIRNLTEFSSD